MILRAAQPADLPTARELLTATELPSEGLEEQFGSGYVIAEQDGVTSGMAGIELYDSFGLLRSVAVSSAARGRGIGERLVRDRLAWAAQHGVRAVYLLTIAAAAYFQRIQFSIVDRRNLPTAIRQSREFVSVCPDNAIAMKWELFPDKEG